MRDMDTAPGTLKQEVERDLIAWTSPARPFKRRDRQFYVTTFAIAGIVSLVLFLAEGAMPVILIISLVFLYYVMSTVEPDNIEYKVTTRGIKIAGRLSEWPGMTRFWFSKRFDNDLLVIGTFAVPGRIEMVVKSEIKEELKKKISDYIPYEEVPASGLDKVTSWIAAKLPGNK